MHYIRKKRIESGEKLKQQPCEFFFRLLPVDFADSMCKLLIYMIMFALIYDFMLQYKILKKWDVFPLLAKIIETLICLFTINTERNLKMTVNILAVGDVCGKTGIDFLYQNLSSIKKSKNIAFTVVNGENANIVGITPTQAENIFSAGADVITLGNHTWARWEIKEYLQSNNRILRPANFALCCPGMGHNTYQTPFGEIAVINLIGRFTLDSNTDNPFYVVDEILTSLRTKMVLVDMHVEATSEKAAMGYYLDGRVSAVWGTHTHVQTSDAGVLQKGTGFITDLGMTGPAISVLGIEPRQSIDKFLGEPPRRYETAEGPGKIECAVFTLDTETGRCLNVEAMRIQ